MFESAALRITQTKLVLINVRKLTSLNPLYCSLIRRRRFTCMVIMFSHLLQKERMAKLTAEGPYISWTHNIVPSVRVWNRAHWGLDVQIKTKQRERESERERVGKKWLAADSTTLTHNVVFYSVRQFACKKKTREREREREWESELERNDRYAVTDPSAYWSRSF